MDIEAQGRSGLALIIAAVLGMGCGNGQGNPTMSSSPTGGAGAAAIGGAGGSLSGGGASGADAAGQGGQSQAAPGLCPISGTRLDSTATLPEGAVLLKGMPADAQLLFLHATDSALFWGNNKGIHRYSLATDVDQVLYQPSADLDGVIEGFDLDGDTVYFSESGRGGLGLAKMPADGSTAPVAFATDSSINLALVADGYFYYVSLKRQTLARVSLGSGTPTDMVPLDTSARGLLKIGDYIWLKFGNDDASHLIRVPTEAKVRAGSGGSGGGGAGGSSGGGAGGASAGGAPSTIALPAEDMATVHLNGALPVTDGVNVYYGDADRVMKLPVQGGTPSSIGMTESVGGPFFSTADVGAILALPSGVMWTQEGCKDVKRVAADGSALSPLLHAARAGWLLANSDFVFVSSGNQILKVKRP